MSMQTVHKKETGKIAGGKECANVGRGFHEAYLLHHSVSVYRERH